MKLTSVYLVCDPTTIATGLRDICWEQDVSKLDRQIIGGGAGWWAKEHVAMHTSKTSALDDAKARVRSKFGRGHADEMFSTANVRRSGL